MKIRSSALTLLFCASLMILPPIASAAPPVGNNSTAMSGKEIDEALKKLPANAKRIAKEAIDLFSLDAHQVSVYRAGHDDWQVSISDNRLSIYLHFSEAGKLTQLSASYYKHKDSSPPITLQSAFNLAEEFTTALLKEKYVPTDHPLLSPNGSYLFDIYPVVDNIPVEQSVATLRISSTGYVQSYNLNNETVKESKLPPAASLLSINEAKQKLLKELQTELVFDVDKERFSYVLREFQWIDAKTGEVTYSPYQVIEEQVGFPVTTVNFRATNDSLKQLGIEYFGFQANNLAVKSYRESHPGETPRQIYTLRDGDDEVKLTFNEDSGSLLAIKSENELRLEKSEIASHDSAKEKALDFIRDYINLAEEKYVLQEQVLIKDIPAWVIQKELPQEYQLSLYPLLNGARASVPAVTVTMNLRGNTMKSVTINDASLAKSKSDVPASTDKEAAAKTLVDSLDLELRYVYPSFLDQNDDQLKLVYVPRLLTTK
ncbi:YcdB/YcdC domain-containing protein [Brevibacillus sp. 179-C 1.1 NHS]|uniref:YcdB/YcdC domain-containing protein n=1 Tax=Brevibacillus sp. 179-C 1.1 NHS TaxID=3235177 RepID=UPI0039A0E2C5